MTHTTATETTWCFTTSEFHGSWFAREQFFFLKTNQSKCIHVMKKCNAEKKNLGVCIENAPCTLNLSAESSLCMY